MSGTNLDRSNRSKIQVGSGAPDSSIPGNLYIDDTNGDLYFKHNGSWDTPISSISLTFDDIYNAGSSAVSVDNGSIIMTSPNGSNNNIFTFIQDDITNNLEVIKLESNVTSSVSVSGFPIYGECILLNGSNQYGIISSFNDIFIGSKYNIGESSAFIRTSSTTKYNPFVTISANKTHADTSNTTSTIINILSTNNSAGDGVINIIASGSIYGSHSGIINLDSDLLLIDAAESIQIATPDFLVTSNLINLLYESGTYSSSFYNYISGIYLLLDDSSISSSIGISSGGSIDISNSVGNISISSTSGTLGLLGFNLSFEDDNLSGATNWNNPIPFSSSSTNWDDAYTLLGNTEGSILDLILAAAALGASGEFLALNGTSSMQGDIDLNGNSLVSILTTDFGNAFISATFLTNTITVDWTDGTYQRVPISANVTSVVFSNPPSGCSEVVLEIVADSTTRTVTGFSNVVWYGGVGTVTVLANSSLYIKFLYDAENTLYKGHLMIPYTDYPSPVISITKDTAATGALTFSGSAVVQTGSTFTFTNTLPSLTQYAIGYGGPTGLLTGNASKLYFNTSDQLIIGTEDFSSDSASLGTTQYSLGVTGRAHFKGISRFSNWIYFDFASVQRSYSFQMLTGVPLYLGTNSDVAFQFCSTASPNKVVLGLNSASNALIICEKADLTTNWNQSLQTNPTLYIQSATTTVAQYISFAHNQTDGVISTGTGAIKFNSVTAILDANTHTISNLLTANFGSAPTTITYGTTVNINWTTGKPIQTITATGDITTFSMTDPIGVTSLCFRIIASGSDVTISGFTGVNWLTDDPDTTTVTIPNGSRAIISLIYMGSSSYEGSIIIGT